MSSASTAYKYQKKLQNLQNANALQLQQIEPDSSQLF